MLAFLDAVLDLDDGEYAKVAMLDCIADARLVGVDNWFSKLLKLLTHVNGGTAPTDALQPDGAVDVDKCLTLWRRHHHRTVWGNLAENPRTAPSKGVALVVYEKWFAMALEGVDGANHWRPAPCITADNIPYSHLISLLKLRTNSHSLNIEMLRHARPRVPRSSRTCPWCSTPGALHDERHCVLECPHLAEARLRYPVLFGQGTETRDMHTLFTDERLVAPLASFVHNLPDTNIHIGTAST
jgi:hypothetical protein